MTDAPGARGTARTTTTHPHPATAGHPTILTGATVVLPTGPVENGQVTVDGTRITHSAPENAQVIDASGHYVIPGFVDLHNHGGGGASFTSGSVDDILKGIHTHRLHGTTTLVASTVTGDMDFLTQRAGLLSELAEQGDVAGIHFEGPFISPAARAPTPRPCCATPTPRTSASWSTRPGAGRRCSRSPPNCPAAWTPYASSPTTA